MVVVREGAGRAVGDQRLLGRRDEVAGAGDAVVADRHVTVRDPLPGSVRRRGEPAVEDDRFEPALQQVLGRESENVVDEGCPRAGARGGSADR